MRLPYRFDRMEWAGGFGDLGTLIPFVLAYITVVKMDAFGVLFSPGVSMLATGLYYRTPFPVQPMKAMIGALLLLKNRALPAMFLLLLFGMDRLQTAKRSETKIKRIKLIIDMLERGEKFH